jgi:hypothetical protein
MISRQAAWVLPASARARDGVVVASTLGRARDLQRVPVRIGADGGGAGERHPTAHGRSGDALRDALAERLENRSKSLRRQLAHDRALAGADDHVAQHLARHVPEQAVQHVRPGELDGTSVQREDVRDQLALDFPDHEKIGQHGEHAERARRQRERC